MHLIYHHYHFFIRSVPCTLSCDLYHMVLAIMYIPSILSSDLYHMALAIMVAYSRARQQDSLCTRVNLLYVGRLNNENQRWPSDRSLRAVVRNKN